LLISTFAWANDGNLNGRIFDKGTKQGLPGVNIVIEEKNTGTFSDGSGNFTLVNLEPGTFFLKASAIGYESYREEIEIVPGFTSNIEIALTESIQVLDGVVINRVSLVKGTSNIKDIVGSAHYLSPRELDKFNNTDINRVLRNIPGMIIQEEDGFGLRPNIGMRGTGVERSSKITLMEDGILVAPAPYAAPAAYYFPSLGRMSGIEIRKGSSQIKYGPYTTGGAINFNSTPIPSEFEANIDLFAGSHGFHNIFANAGASFKNIGFMAESLMTNSNGFKDLDNGGDTGYSTEDYIAKIRVHSDPDSKVYQSLTFKMGQSKENSNETYLGLTDADFLETPFRRYAGSQKDNMINKQNQWHLRYAIQPAKFLDITTTVYHSDFERNWYKLDKVKASDSTGYVNIASILQFPEMFIEELNIIKGTTSLNDDALMVKANNRSYFMEGLESVIGLTFPGATVNNEIELGIRLHRDQMDRYQWIDTYKMENGIMMLTEAGIPGTESNYVLDASAIASFIQYKFEYLNLTVIPGLRYENIFYEKRDYGKEDPGRTGNDLTTNDHNVDIFIPGVGIDYTFTDHISSFIGIHKGFSPPGLKEGTRPEISINYEAGLRYNTPFLSIQSVFYYNDYENLLGSDLTASGGTGSGNQFNGGESIIYGIEYELMYNPLGKRKSTFGLPITFNYTFINATFRNTFESEYEPWGSVQEGYEIPYIPKHQLTFNISLEHKRFNMNYSSKFVGDMRTVAGEGFIPDNEKISAYYVADLSSNVLLNKYVTLFGSINNIFNNVYMVSRRPAGVRPGLPLNFRIGFKAHFY
jgi:Fe(3+) dicitrate transport protein